MTIWGLALVAPAGPNHSLQQYHLTRSLQIQAVTRSSSHPMQGSSSHHVPEQGPKWTTTSTTTQTCLALRSQNWLKTWIILTSCLVILLRGKRGQLSNSRMRAICSCIRWVVRTRTKVVPRSNPSSSSKTHLDILLNLNAKTVLMTMMTVE